MSQHDGADVHLWQARQDVDREEESDGEVLVWVASGIAGVEVEVCGIALG